MFIILHNIDWGKGALSTHLFIESGQKMSKKEEEEEENKKNKDIFKKMVTNIIFDFNDKIFAILILQ